MTDLKISQFTDGGLVATSDDIAAVRIGGNVKVRFGSAAAASLGTDGEELPDNDAVDGKISAALSAYMLPDGTYGVLTMSGGSFTYNDASIAYAKIQNVSANKILGSVAGGAPEEITFTAQARQLCDDTTFPDMLTTLGALPKAGITTGVMPSAGEIGQTIETVVLSGAAVSIAVSGTVYTIASNSLPAGFWQSSGGIRITSGASGNATAFEVEISDQTSAFNSPIDPGRRHRMQIAAVVINGAARDFPCPTVQKNVSSSSTHNLNVAVTFSVSGWTAYGKITSRRVG